MSFLGLHAIPSESLPAAATFALYTMFFVSGFAGSVKAFKIADRVGGKRLMTKGSNSNRLFAAIVPFINFACMVVPLAYYVTLPLRAWKVPAWAEPLSLPEPVVGGALVWQWIGVGLLVATYGFYGLSLYTIAKQGAFSGLEPRERHRLVDSGPYSIVRHPLYFVAIAVPLWITLSLWNAAPLIQFFGYVASLGPKIPVEEALLEDKDVLGAKYTEYKKKVPFRVFPYIW